MDILLHKLETPQILRPCAPRTEEVDRHVRSSHHCDIAEPDKSNHFWSLVQPKHTRTSKKLLRHYDIDTATNSLHMHNEHRLIDRYIKRIKEGDIIAIISDAGTPLISDPGSLFVKECIKESIVVECLPGATAFLPALVGSGINTKQFVFEGFLPLKKGRASRLKYLMEEKSYQSKSG